jgi:hypothetical protein
MRGRDFSQIQFFTLFIGHPRNGSSILGGLLDAHPNIVISHELDVLKNVHIKKKALFDKIIENAHKHAQSGRKAHCGYSSKIADSWQGRYKGLKIVGDKKADWTALHLLKHPGRLELLQDVVEVPIKFIHTVRNPFDNCSTIMLRKGANKNYTLSTGDGNMQGGVISFYFDQIVNSVLQVREKIPKENWMTVYHEDFVATPRKVVKKMCNFLGQKANKAYLDQCKSKTRNKPNITRKKIIWQDKEIAEVQRRMAKVDFLRRYL